MNIVPCAIHLDLVFYPFHIYWFTSANSKLPIPSPLPTFTTTVFCSSVCGTGIWKDLRQLVLEVSSAAATRYSLGLWLPDREGNGTPLQYSCLENPIHGGAWWAAVHGVAKSRTQLSDFTFTFSLSCIGEGNGNPLQCSCLENPRDGGAWWAAVYGVTQSWTWLKWLSSSKKRLLTWEIWGLFLHPPPSSGLPLLKVGEQKWSFVRRRRGEGREREVRGERGDDSMVLVSEVLHFSKRKFASY